MNKARLITAPTSEPVTLAEAKEHLRIENSLDDATITRNILAARMYVEEYCWRGLVTQTWELTLDEFPLYDDVIELPKGNLQSITSVKYTDAGGALNTVDPSGYTMDQLSVPGTVRLPYLGTWPTGVRTVWNAIVIQYVVGWDVANVPAPIKQALLLLVSQMYEHRAPEVVGTIVNSVKFTFDALLAPYRLARF